MINVSAVDIPLAKNLDIHDVYIYTATRIITVYSNFVSPTISFFNNQDMVCHRKQKYEMENALENAFANNELINQSNSICTAHSHSSQFAS